ncbi:MAG: N-acetyl-gamma-glutamyl-phosphate reductase [Planctomycetota bacterium]
MSGVPTFVFGGRGLLAGEFARLALGHPRLELAALISREVFACQSEQPHLVPPPPVLATQAGVEELVRTTLEHERALAVLALPHGRSAALFDALQTALGHHAERLVVLDLAADFRLVERERHRATYGDEAHPARVNFTYGLPELFRDAWRERPGSHVAAPGCFATALQLATVPAARAELLDADAPWIYFGITGSSGSGATPGPGTHHPHRAGNLWAYATNGHRHEAELLQAVAPLTPRVHFVPHSGPFVRGIHLTATLPLRPGVTEGDARAAFAAAYRDEPFVGLPEGRPPMLRAVVGSNRAELGVSVRAGLLTVLLTLDNLLKGGAGQGLQAINRRFGWDETTGLPVSGQGVA